MKFQEKYNNNSFLSKFEISADASKDFIEDLGLPKSVVDGTKLEGTIGHDPKSKKSIVNMSPTIVDEEIGKFKPVPMIKINITNHLTSKVFIVSK